ncbi:MAG: hypothetical protein ACRDHE_15480, partial [Ktedonobacterales bacterium]
MLRLARSIPFRLARRVRGIPRLLVSVRVRLALWYLAVLALVFLIFGGIVYKTTAQNVENAQSAALISTSQQLLRNYNASTGQLDVQDPFTNAPNPSSGGKPGVAIAKG